jgi:ATP-dependent DNA helicase HFM1/MER3
MHGDLDFEHIDNFANPTDAVTRKNTAKNKMKSKAKDQNKTGNVDTDDDAQEPLQLSNGKWACKHVCKDKNACKHLCCKEGMDKPPKKSAISKHTTLAEDHHTANGIAPNRTPKVTQSKLQLTAYKRKMSSAVEELDLTQEEKRQKTDLGKNGPRDYRELHQLHTNIQKNDPPSVLHSVMHTKPSYCYSQGGEHSLSFLEQPGAGQSEDLSDYGDIPPDVLSSHFDMPESMSIQRNLAELNTDMDPGYSLDYPVTGRIASCASETFGDDDSLLGDAMLGLADSQILKEIGDGNDDITFPTNGSISADLGSSFQDDISPMNIDNVPDGKGSWRTCDEAATSIVPASKPPLRKSRAPFCDTSSGSDTRLTDFKPAKALLQGSNLEDCKQAPRDPPTLRHVSNDTPLMDNTDTLNVLDMLNDHVVRDESSVPDAFKGLEPWLFQEFGGIVELVDE